jgi:class 3 adenylate cyclase
VEESDGDLIGDGVNIAARLEGVCEPGGVCLSEDAYAGKPSSVQAVAISINNHSGLCCYQHERTHSAGRPAGNKPA